MKNKTDEIIENFSGESWQKRYPSSEQQRAIGALEAGKILLFPQLGFPLSKEELSLALPQFLKPETKNISYTIQTGELRGTNTNEKESQGLKQLLQRYCEYAKALVIALMPTYQDPLIVARTSLRPSEIKGRASSYRKDDTRLHVDAFPASPTHGLRILRVFTNINAHGQPRIWRVGEPFPTVADKFLRQLRRPFPGEPWLLQLLRVTRKKRTYYDHLMLQLHDRMKGDDTYQQQADQQEFHFAPGNSWIVFTDQVSHAAMSGQNVLEQTFYLPVHALSNPDQSPLRILEKMTARSLV